jgi:WD40 repeat protein
MFCTRCGAHSDDDATFCAACGNRLRVATVPATREEETRSIVGDAAPPGNAGERPRQLVDPTKSSILSLCFSPDGRWLVSGGLIQRDVDSGTATLWDAATGAVVRTFGAPGLSFTSVDFSPDGQWLALAATCGDPLDSVKQKRNSLSLWNASRPEEMRPLEGHPGQVFCVKFSPDGRLLAATNGSDVVSLWEVSTGRKVRMLDTSGGMGLAGNLLKGAVKGVTAALGATGEMGCALAFSGDGQWLATGDVLGVGISGVSSGARMKVLSTGLEAKRLALIAFTDDDKSLIEVRCGGIVRVWDWGKGTQRQSYTYPDFVYAALSPSKSFLATAKATESAIDLWKVIGAEHVRKIDDADRVWRPEALAFSPDGHWLAAAGFGGQISVNSTADLH